MVKSFLMSGPLKVLAALAFAAIGVTILVGTQRLGKTTRSAYIGAAFRHATALVLALCAVVIYTCGVRRESLAENGLATDVAAVCSLLHGIGFGFALAVTVFGAVWVSGSRCMV